MSNLGNKEIMAENMRYYLNKLDIPRTKLAEMLGVSYSSVTGWVNGESYPRIDRIEAMAKIFKVNKSDLVEKRGVEEKRIETIVEPIYKTVQIPVLSHIACGEPLLIEENATEYVTEPINQLPNGKCFYLRVQGDSMMPTIPDRSLVLVRSQPEVENDEIAAVVLLDTNEATLKRVKYVSGQILLMPDNPKYEPIVLNGNRPAKIVGKAVRITIEL